MQSSLNNSNKPLSIVADQQILLAKEIFSSFGDVELVNGRSIDQNTVQNTDILLVRSVTNVDESLLRNSNISFVGSATSGINHINTAYLEKCNISFSHASGSNARSVAEYVLSSLLVLAEHQNFNLVDKTIGIIGCGQVGSRVKRFMEILGVKCLINDPPLANHCSDYDFLELEAFSEADIITLHVPLIMKGDYPTYKLVDNGFLNKLKSDVTIVNTSRGEVIDEDALFYFKQANDNATLILDVWCGEPKINVNLLQKAFIATPHIAGYSYDGKLKATQMLFNALNDHLNAGFKKQNLLNSEIEVLSINDDEIQLPILQSYDVRTDAIGLSNIISMNEQDRAAYFDSMRKNYPIRREFTNRAIQTSKMSESTRQKLQQLGFKL